MKTKLIAAIMGLVALALPSFADTDVYGNEINPTNPKTGETIEYRFWVSGTKAEIATKSNSVELSSPNTSLATGTYSTPAAEPIALEARFRTWLESVGIALRSDLRKGLMLMIR